MADRAMAPVVGKALEAALVVLYVGLLTSALYGHAVPTYRTTAGDAVGERALSAATQEIQAAVPPNATDVDVRVEVPLPDAVRGEPYFLRADGMRLRLDHPHPSVGGSQRLALPGSVVSVAGEWRSDRPAILRISTTDGGLAVELVEGSA